MSRKTVVTCDFCRTEKIKNPVPITVHFDILNHKCDLSFDACQICCEKFAEMSAQEKVHFVIPFIKEKNSAKL